MISQLRILSEELSKTSSIGTAVQSMARILSDTGKWSRFFLGVLQAQNQITHLESSGFEKDSLNLDQYGTFLLAEVDLDFGGQNQIILRPHDSIYQKTFETYCGVEDSYQWKTTILMPMLPGYFAALTSQNLIERNSSNLDYFETIRAIFMIFLKSQGRSIAGQSRSQSLPRRNTESSTLTERQELILKMIKAGNTNMAIAMQMGYSESLIRQESIAIYRKLGISGRRDLGLSSD